MKGSVHSLNFYTYRGQLVPEAPCSYSTQQERIAHTDNYGLSRGLGFMSGTPLLRTSLRPLTSEDRSLVWVCRCLTSALTQGQGWRVVGTVAPWGAGALGSRSFSVWRKRSPLSGSLIAPLLICVFLLHDVVSGASVCAPPL